MKVLGLTTIFFLTLTAYGQEGPKIGQKSPELAFEKIINYKRNQTSLSDFKGKMVILDFWATWCAPCIKSFPHLEALQVKFNTEIQIITITDDPEERIKRFLNTQHLKLPVVIDVNRKLSSAFPHRSLPHTVVIDKAGVVKAITTSSEISETLIRDILSGHKVDIKEKRDVMNFDPTKPLSNSENFSYQVTITPFQQGFPSFSNTIGSEPYKNRRILATNISPSSLFEIAHRFPAVTRTKIEVKDSKKLNWNEQNAVCFDLIVPEQLGEQRFNIMKKHLSTYFEYVSVVEERVVPVKILRLIKGKVNASISEAEPSEKRYSSQSGKGLAMKNSPILTLTRFLESRLNKPVVDETGLTGAYNLEIPWYNEKPEEINVELEKLGLELIDDRRKIDVLVVKDK